MAPICVMMTKFSKKNPKRKILTNVIEYKQKLSLRNRVNTLLRLSYASGIWNVSNPLSNLFIMTDGDCKYGD